MEVLVGCAGDVLLKRVAVEVLKNPVNSSRLIYLESYFRQRIDPPGVEPQNRKRADAR